jgi:hypothetical protein
MRSLLLASVVLSCAVAPIARAQAPTAAQVHAALVGHWVGTLEYKDYQNPDRREVLPTVIDGTAIKSGGVALHFIYDDGPGKTVLGDDRFIMTADARSLDWTGAKESAPSIFRVLSLARDSEKGFTMIVEQESEDDRAPATLRETLTFRGDSLTILKEVKPTGKAFSFRHQYKLAKR